MPEQFDLARSTFAAYNTADCCVGLLGLCARTASTLRGRRLPGSHSFVPLSKLSVHAAAGPAGLAHFLGPPNRLLVDKDHTISVKVNIVEVLVTYLLT